MNKNSDSLKKRQGRPSTYTVSLAETICMRLMAGESLNKICRDKGMPDESTVRYWALINCKVDPEDCEEEGFFPKYSRAREIQYDVLAEQTIDIADDGCNDYGKDEDGNRVVDHDHIKRSQLRVAARQWFVSKLSKRKYGDHREIDMNANVNASINKLSPRERAEAVRRAAERDTLA